jgi:eukaryotic-like serine/threonine-protein kinase
MSENIPPLQTVDPLIGTVIQESFRIDGKLGQGGMGAIYLAEHLRLKKKVAIKCLHAGLASKPEVIRRFKNEAVAASSIGHPHIINVMDMGQFADGTFFMVLEFLDGKDWQQQLDESGAQPAAEVAHIGLQICAALGAASAKGIVHRDLKPENIFLIDKLGDKNFVKVLDFGISKILDGTGGATKTGALMGTPYYMSPEQVLGKKEVTHLTDIYALGVIFFQALSGAVPFEGETLAQIILKIASEPTPSLAKRAPGVPLPFCRLVGQMMQKEPSDRPQTFEEVAEKLLPLLSESPTAASASRPAFDLGQIPKGLWGIGAALGLVTGGIVWALGGNDEPALEFAAETKADENDTSEDVRTDTVRLQSCSSIKSRSKTHSTAT